MAEPMEINDVLPQRDQYRYLTDKEFQDNRHLGTRALNIYHGIRQRSYENGIKNYGLRENRNLQCAEGVNNNREIIVHGKTGVGKSATLNTIVGINNFPDNSSSDSVTKALRYMTIPYSNRMITVIDTPGTHSTTHTPAKVSAELARVAFLLREGVHCFIVCLNASDNRFTHETEEMLTKMLFTDSDVIQNYTMVVYTKPETELGKVPLNMYLKRQRDNDKLCSFLGKVGDKVLAVNNKTDIPAEKERNREAIIAMVDKVVQQNIQNGRPAFITNGVLRQAQELYRTVTEIITAQDRHPAFADAIIETIITSYRYQKFRESDFVSNVLKLIRTNENSNIEGQNCTFQNGDDITVIALDACELHIKEIHIIIKQQVLGFYAKVATIVAAGLAFIFI